MAGDWLKFEIATLDKPEVWAIAQDLGIDPDAVIGKLLRVWSWFDQQSIIGNAPSVTKALLDRCAGVAGFCDSVIKAGWMFDDGAFLSLPNFERHNGKTAKTRAQTGKRVKNHRYSEDEKSNAPSVTKPLPENRREENIKNTKPFDTADAVSDNVPVVLPLAPLKKPKADKGHRLPDDWILPKAAGEWAMTEGLSRDQVLREAERFKDYWHSKPGREALKTDWAATWRNWIRKAVDGMPAHRKQQQGGASMFAREHGDTSWADGLTFIQKHTDPTWRAGL